jgi:CRISPR-associated protein Csm3
MVLLEDDHLGGQGSRGYGKVEFINISLQWRPRDYYLTGDEGNIVKPGGSNVVPKQIATNFELIMSAISNPKAS